MAKNEAKIKVSVEDKASGKLKGIGAKAKSMRSSFLMVGAAGAAVVGAMALSIKSFAQTGDAIQKMSLRTGISTIAISEMKFALEQSGSSIEGFEKGIRRMSSFIQDGRDGMTETTRAMESMGVSVEDFAGMEPEAAFDVLSNALAGVDDTLTQAALAQDIFGRAGTALLPLLAQGEEGIAALRKEAHELGIVFDQDAANAAARLVDAQNTLTKSFDGVKFAIAEQLVPSLSPLLEGFAKTVSKISAWAKENPVLAKTVVALALGIGTLAIAIAGIGLVLPIMATGLGFVTVGFIGLNIATGGLIIGIGLLVAGIFLLIKNWDTVVRAIKIGINFMIGAAEMWVNGYIKGFNFIIEGLNKLAGVFGITISKIAEVELPRLDTSIKKTADIVKEESDTIIETNEEVGESFQAAAEEVEDWAQKIADAHSESVQRFIEMSRKATAETERRANLEAGQREKTKQALADATAHTDRRLIAEWEQKKDWTRKMNEQRDRMDAKEVADAQEQADILVQQAKDENERLIQEEKDYQEQLDREREEEIQKEKDKQAELVQAEKDYQDELKILRAQALADTLKNAEFRMDAVEALREENREAFALIKAEVDLLPANIQVGGGSTEQLAGRAGVMQAFKNSQYNVQRDLDAATQRLRDLESGFDPSDPSVVDPNRVAAIAAARAEMNRLLGVTESAGFKGGDLGALLAPPGGFGSGGPPMLPGMEFKQGVPGVSTTINFYGDTFGLDDFNEKVNESITEAQNRGGALSGIGMGE